MIGQGETEMAEWVPMGGAGSKNKLTGNAHDFQLMRQLSSTRHPGRKGTSNAPSRTRKQQKHIIFATCEIAGQLFRGFVSFYIFGLYLAQTYVVTPDKPGKPPQSLKISEWVGTALLFLDIANNIWILAESKKSAFFSFSTALDIITIVLLLLECRPCTGFWRVWRLIKLVQFGRSWRLMRASGGGAAVSQELITSTQFLVVVVQVIAFFLLWASVFLSVNRHFPKQFAISAPDGSPSYFTQISALYFSLITVTTLGYGDYYPSAPWSRMLDCFFFITAVVWLTLVTQKISRLYSQRGQYSSKYRIHSRRVKHVVVAGGRALSPLKLRGFLRQFFHPDHGSIRDTKCVILVGGDGDTSELLEVATSEYAENTHLLIGDFFDDIMLERKAQLRRAQALFLLAGDGGGARDDVFVVLAAHKASLLKPTLRINAQINSRNFLQHSWCGWANVYSIQEFKMGILAANAFNPGFCPLILNLLRSSSKYAFKQQTPWLLEYNQGLEHEIYLIPGRVCEGILFSKLVRQAYQARGALVIGVKTRPERAPTIRRNATSALEDRKSVWLNPASHIVQASDEVIVLAKDSAHARSSVEPENWMPTLTIPRISSQRINKRSNLKLPRTLRPRPSEQALRRQSTLRGALLQHEADDVDSEQSAGSDGERALGLKDLKFSKNYDYKSARKLAQTYFPIWKCYVRGLQGHILVFGGEVEAAVSLIDTLCLFTSNFICYVSDRPKDQAWEQHMSNKPGNILYFECSYSNPKQLRKTGIETAQHVIVLSWTLEGSNSHDSGMLQVVRTIEQFFPQVKYTLELVDQANIKFISCHKQDLKLPLTCRSAFASGKLLYTSTLEAIVAQIYYNDSILSIMNKIIFADLRREGYSRNAIENSKLNFISIRDSPDLPIIKYAEMFGLLVEEGVIPIALYRSIDGYLGNNQRYVVTNPDPEIVLLKQDLVLVLGDTQDSRSRRLRAQTKSVNRDYMLQISKQISMAEPEREDTPAEEPDPSSPKSTPKNLPEIIRLDEIQPKLMEKNEPQLSIVDHSDSIPEELQNEQKIAHDSRRNISMNVSKILERPSLEDQKSKDEEKQVLRSLQKESSMMNSNQQEQKQEELDYQQLDDQTLLLLIAEQLKLSSRDRSLLKQQEGMLLKLKKGRIMQKVRTFVDNLKRAVRRKRTLNLVEEQLDESGHMEPPPKHSDMMNLSLSNVGHNSDDGGRFKPKFRDPLIRKYPERSDLSMPSNPSRPVSLVRKLLSEQDKNPGPRVADMHSMVDTHSAQQSISMLSHQRNPKMRANKSVQLVPKSFG